MKKNRRGMTFIEVEMALLLLLLGVLAVIEISPISLRGVQVAEAHTQAGQYAQQILEQELAHSYRYEQGLMTAWLQAGSALPQQVVGNIVPSKPVNASDIVVAGAPAGRYSYRILRANHPTMPGPGGSPIPMYSPTPAAYATPPSDGVIIISVEVWWSEHGASHLGAPAVADSVVKAVGYKSGSLAQ